MPWFKSFRWRTASACVLVAAFAIVASQPSAASVVPSHGGSPSTVDPVVTSPIAGDASTVASVCNGPAFSPPTSTNTTYAGSATFLPLTSGVATPNLWNVRTSAGKIRQCYNAESGFRDTIDLSSLSLDSTTAPAGFPEIGYGESSYGEHFCGVKNPGCEIAPFPIPVSSLAKYPYLASVSYSMGSITPAQYVHLTFDLWLEQSVNSKGPKPADVEIMIEPYNTYPACGVARPAFHYSGATWDVSEGCGGSKATTLHFVLQSSEQRKTGKVTVNLSSFVAEVKKILPRDASVDKEKMAGIEVGTEFNNYGCPGTTCSPQRTSAKFSWSVSALSLVRSSPVPDRSRTYHIVG